MDNSVGRTVESVLLPCDAACIKKLMCFVALERCHRRHGTEIRSLL